MRLSLISCLAASAATTMLSACGAPSSSSVESPDGNIRFNFALENGGTPSYSVSYGGKEVIKPSTLGFLLVDSTRIADGFKVESVDYSDFSEKWVPVWGENDSIDNTYRQMTVCLSSGKYKMNIEARVFNDGVGFRYVFPEQEAKTIEIAEELTQFAMTGDHTAWWIPGDYDTQEYAYNTSRLSEIRGINTSIDNSGNVSTKAFSPTGVQTSLLMRDDADSLYINIHEAALIDYPAMHLDLDEESMTFQSWLTPGMEVAKAEIATPFATPWRVIMLGSATDILATNIIYNLNAPCAYDDTSWIHPTKYMGVWWEMITGKSQWSYTWMEDVDLNTVDYSKTKPHGKHGANNANVRRYIDFAADNGFDQLLIEGWNIGWEDWFGKQKDFVFDFVTPYPDFDIKALNDYAHSKGIKLMMHHETSGSINNYEAHMDTAYNLMNQFGYDAVKSGYVGNIIGQSEDGTRRETHYSQRMVRHYLDAVKRAADHHIMVNGHEAVRPTGLARTYPNLVGNESAMGTEYRQHIPSDHVTILPFTRLKGGPMDFTPGIFTMNMGEFVPGSTDRRITTVAKELGTYVTFYSPLQMAADMPENYAKKMDAFQFIKDVPVDWKKSIYLDAIPGEYIIAARQDKNSDNWFVGGVNADNARPVEVKLDFLPAGRQYKATIYADAPDTDAYTNPETYTITTETVTSASTIPVTMANGGGFAISLHAL